MKKLIYAIFFILPFNITGQECELPMIDGKYEIRKVVKLDSIQKSKIYTSSLISLAELFKNSDEVIEYKNENEGVILAKFVTKNSITGFGPRDHYFRFQLRFEFKDGRYRIIVNYLSHEVIWTGAPKSCSCPNSITDDECGNGMCVFNKEWNKQKSIANSQVQKILQQLEGQIEKNLNSLSTNDDEW